MELSSSLPNPQPLSVTWPRKFDLYGKNEYEKHKVEEYLSSTDGALLAHSIKVVRAVDIPPEKRVEQTSKFYAEEVLKFITIHEAHLERNGSNGHYVSQSTTLADLKTALFIDRVFYLRSSGADEVPFSAEKSPNLWRLRETVNNHPSLAEWRKSQRYQELKLPPGDCSSSSKIWR
jgi:glutathione S-transferase